MLVLSRRQQEKVLFPSLGVTVQVVGIKSGAVRLGITAPPDVAVLREEVSARAAEWGAPAPAAAGHVVDAQVGLLKQLLDRRLGITRTCLAQLRRQLLAGHMGEAEELLDKLDEDVRLLGRRLEGEVEKVTPPAAPPLHARALLVEDNANERELMALFLRSAGLDVATAGDGADALDYLHTQGAPDVVLLDMGLPRVDGPATVRAIRRDPAYAGLKIFAVTGHDPEEFDLASGPAGIDRWFHKPIDPGQLVEDLTQALPRRLCRR